MKNAWKLFDYGETPIYLKYWFLGLFLFIPVSWVLMIFISILIHEMSHARTAKKLGYKTDYIFIDILHGGALVDNKYIDNNKHAISIASAGPVSNLILALIGFLSATIFTSLDPDYINSPVIPFLAEFITINLILFVANLVPIYPLDGGRISKAFSKMCFGEDKGRVINGIISMVLSLCVLVYGIIKVDFIWIIFSVVFLISSYGEIKSKKDEL